MYSIIHFNYIYIYRAFYKFSNLPLKLKYIQRILLRCKLLVKVVDKINEILNSNKSLRDSYSRSHNYKFQIKFAKVLAKVAGFLFDFSRDAFWKFLLSEAFRSRTSVSHARLDVPSLLDVVRFQHALKRLHRHFESTPASRSNGFRVGGDTTSRPRWTERKRRFERRGLTFSQAGTFWSITATAKLNFLGMAESGLTQARIKSLRPPSKPRPLMKRTALNLKDFPRPSSLREVEGNGNSRPRAKLQSTGSFILFLSFLNYVFEGGRGGEGGESGCNGCTCAYGSLRFPLPPT